MERGIRIGERAPYFRALAAVIGESAEIAGFYQGREPVEAVLRMLEGDSSVPSRGSEI
jgi:hypothetical protein